MAGVLKKGHAIAGLVVGAILLLTGLIIIILSAVMSGKADVGAILGPWWAGVLFMIPGILGVVAGITKNRCSMIAFLVLNIIILIAQSIVTALMGLVVAILAAFKEVSQDCTKSGPTTCKCNHNGTTFTMNGIEDCELIGDIYSLGFGVLMMMIIAVIACFAGSIIGCVAVCCNGNNTTAGTTVIIQQGNGQQQQGQPPAYNQPEQVKY